MPWDVLVCTELYWALRGGPSDSGELGSPGGKGVTGFPGVLCGQVGRDEYCGRVVRVVQVVMLVRMISLDDRHSESMWFSWSKPSNYQEKLRYQACDGRRRKVENRAVSWKTTNRNNQSK